MYACICVSFYFLGLDAFTGLDQYRLFIFDFCVSERLAVHLYFTWESIWSKSRLISQLFVAIIS
jgi:hypothetical protein